MLEGRMWVPVWAYEPTVEVIDTDSVAIGVRLHNANDRAWRELFASSEGADEFEAQLTTEGVWIRTEPDRTAAALDWLRETIDTSNALRGQQEAERDEVRKQVAEWEQRRDDT